MSNYREICVSFEEFIESELKAERASLNLLEARCSEALIHGHCHQKAARSMAPVEPPQTVPGERRSLRHRAVEWLAFRLSERDSERILSNGRTEFALAVREANTTARIVADGTSCRHQIADNTPRQVEHVAVLLAEHLGED